MLKGRSGKCQLHLCNILPLCDSFNCFNQNTVAKRAVWCELCCFSPVNGELFQLSTSYIYLYIYYDQAPCKLMHLIPSSCTHKPHVLTCVCNQRVEQCGAFIAFHGELYSLCRWYYVHDCKFMCTGYFWSLLLVYVCTCWMYLLMPSQYSYVHTAASMTEFGSAWSRWIFKALLS